MEPSIKYAFVSRSSSVCDKKMGSDFSMANRLRLALLLVFLWRLYFCFAPTPKLLILLLVISMRQSVLKKNYIVCWFSSYESGWRFFHHISWLLTKKIHSLRTENFWKPQHLTLSMWNTIVVHCKHFRKILRETFDSLYVVRN